MLSHFTDSTYVLLRKFTSVICLRFRTYKSNHIVLPLPALSRIYTYTFCPQFFLPLPSLTLTFTLTFFHFTRTLPTLFYPYPQFSYPYPHSGRKAHAIGTVLLNHAILHFHKVIKLKIL